jgi:multidrug efflux pump
MAFTVPLIPPLCEAFYFEGGGDICRSNGAGVSRYAAVSAQNPLHAYPCNRGPGGAAGHLYGDAISGYSINILTMFGMVLAIGIIVDDAIVVVENVERLMEEKGLSPKQATREAMSEITPAIMGITLVLTAVFIPMGFADGSVGIIYRQFCISMAVSILLSAFLALTLTPALCATLLRPHQPDRSKGGRFSAWFNARFHRLPHFTPPGSGLF